MDMSGPAVLAERLMEEWQRDFPLVPRPYAEIARRLGAEEGEVIASLKRVQSEGLISRVGGVVRPNTLGASTLAAIAVPGPQIDVVAALLAAEPGINHLYLREDDWNLWFVVTGPDRDYINQALERISDRTGRRVLDLRLERPYHIDLGFSLSGTLRHVAPATRVPRAGIPAADTRPGDHDLAQLLTTGLPLVPRPYQDIAASLKRTETEIIDRLKVLTASGLIARMGVIVRHRAVGWSSNAMVVWDVPPESVDGAGAALVGTPGVNLCYRRTRHPHDWPYNLYCMVHARSREEAHSCIARAQSAAGLGGLPRNVLFSLRCFKQTGAMIALPREAA